MSGYNPHSPEVLGVEWVPLRSDRAQLTPAANTVEMGHRFRLNELTQIGHVRFYAEPPTFDSQLGQTFAASIYPAGAAHLSGPIRSVNIPVSSATVTGAAESTELPTRLLQETSPDITLNAGAAPVAAVIMGFEVDKFPVLNNKRILGVNWHITMAGFRVDMSTTDFRIKTVNTFPVTSTPPFLLLARPDVDTSGDEFLPFEFVIHMGEVNYFWTTGAPQSDPYRPAWTWQDLMRFASDDSNRLYASITTGTLRGVSDPNALITISESHLEVIYCEEQRVAFGAATFGGTAGGGAVLATGVNKIQMFDMNGIANPFLLDGEYDIVISSVDVRGTNAGVVGQSGFPDLIAAREFQELSDQPGIRVDVPYPMDTPGVINRKFTAEQSDVLPMLSIHETDDTIVTQPHAYGRRIDAHVYDLNTASQQLEMSTGVGHSYDQVRFYTRRFGDTVEALTLMGASPSVSGSSVSITPEELDALPEIIDGYREVTLRFNSPPVAFLETVLWRFSTTEENAGNRWEVMGASAPAISGLSYPPLNITGAAAPALATYGGTDAIAYWGPNDHGAMYRGVRGVATTPDDATLDLTGIIDMRVAFKADSLATGSSQTLISKGETAGNQRSYWMEISPTGSLTMGWSTNGTNVLTSTSSSPIPSNATQVRIVFNPNNGANRTVSFYYGYYDPDDPASPLVAGWTLINTVTDAITTVFSGSGALSVGMRLSTSSPFFGTIMAAMVVNGTTSLIVAYPLFDKQPAGTTSFTDAFGRPWTLRSDAFVDMTKDETSDLIVLMSQDPPVVSGLSVTTESLSLTVADECLHGPCCAPTALQYNRITWDPQHIALILPNESGATASTPDDPALDITGDIDIRVDCTSDTWPPASNVNLVTKFGVGSNQRSYLFRLMANGTLRLQWSTDGTAGTEVIATSTIVTGFIAGRHSVRATLDVNNGAGGWTVRFYVGPSVNGPWTQLGDDVVGVGVTSVFAGTQNLIVSESFAGAIHAVEIRNGIDGAAVANPDFTAQPVGTTSFQDGAGRTWTINGTAKIDFDTSQTWTFELQRMDDTDLGWQTIMLATSPAVTGFSDYEALVGVEASYRMRQINALRFEGSWTDVVTATIPTPGVTLPSCGTGKSGILIFTTNEHQDGSSNLAYAPTFDEVVEEFSHPEADDVTFNKYHDRDYAVAFHGTERGGETFSRRLLLQNASVVGAPRRVPQPLADLAWDSVPYVCVRDDAGDRWLGTIVMPTSTMRRNKRLHNVEIIFVETTDTPSEVSL